MATESKTTTDHDTIRRWAEKRGAVPSTVARTRSAKDVGIIRLDFPGFSGEGTLAPITWDEFFEKFDDEGLAFVFQERTAAGKTSNFNRFIKRGHERRSAKKPSAKRAAAPKRSATPKRAAAKRTTKKAAAPKRAAKPTRSKTTPRKKTAARPKTPKRAARA